MDTSLQEPHYRALDGAGGRARRRARCSHARCAAGARVAILWHNNRFDRRSARATTTSTGVSSTGRWRHGGLVTARRATIVATLAKQAEACVIRVVHLSVVHTPDDPRIYERECRTLAEAGYDVTYLAPGAGAAATSTACSSRRCRSAAAARRFLDARRDRRRRCAACDRTCCTCTTPSC